ERERVLVASICALDAGVRIGMKRGGVLAICPDAILYERDEKHEQAVLNSVALCLLQYTPELAFTEQYTLVLDVTASFRAFGGIRALFRLVHESVLELGFTAKGSIAPTAQGAWLLAHASAARSATSRRRCLRMETLMSALNRLPSHFLLSVRP